MDINKFKSIMESAKQNLDDSKKANTYAYAIPEVLKSNKFSAEIAAIIVKGMDIDHGANFCEYLSDLSINDLKTVWETLKKSQAVNDIIDGNNIKFLANIIYSAIIKEGQLEKFLGNYISLITVKLTSDKAPIPKTVYGPILMDYIVENLPADTEYPKWDTLTRAISVENIKEFTELFLGILNQNEQGNNVLRFKQWLKSGLDYSIQEIDRKRIEDKIPKSKISVLQELVKHYTVVENQLRDSVYHIDSLEKKAADLNAEIAILNQEKLSLQGEIRSLEGKINEKQKNLVNAQKEAEERKKINDAADALNNNDKESMLKEIGTALKAEYRDFIDSEHDDMDPILGEIYREKIKNIFKILEQKGVRVD